MKLTLRDLDQPPDRESRYCSSTLERALKRTPNPRREPEDDPARTAFLNRLVVERKVFGGKLHPDPIPDPK